VHPTSARRTPPSVLVPILLQDFHLIDALAHLGVTNAKAAREEGRRTRALEREERYGRCCAANLSDMLMVVPYPLG